MKVSVNWLREIWEGDASSAEIAECLTQSGLEVEGESRLGDGVAGVIVAEVRGKRPHPKADKLSLVDVFDGREVAQVVCGAPNVPPPGGRVAWARPGAVLPGGRAIAPKEVRGVLSPGMLCAEDELGLSASHEGLLILDQDAEPGADVVAHLGLPYVIFEVNVTPNRPDCLSHFGLAREVAAAWRSRTGEWSPPLNADIEPRLGEEPIESLAAVDLEDAQGCPRYIARVVIGVTVGPSPLKVRLRLSALGVRAINNVVDATNLALFGHGQPLHAFDLDRLAGRKIVVRRARPGEEIVTLDGEARRIDPEDIVICDAEKPVALAGIMGGANSEVGEATTRILLESAYFDARRIRRTARRVGLQSEASLRFERGTDPNDGVAIASLRCAHRIAGRTGGQVARGTIDRYPQPILPAEVPLRFDRTSRLLGQPVERSVQVAVLATLGIQAEAEGEVARCRVPTWRPDLTREIDLIEEIARVHGYDRVMTTLPALAAAPDLATPLAQTAEVVRDTLAALGLAETISFSFVSPAGLDALGMPADQRLRLAKPLREEQSALRTSLILGLAEALRYNLAHGVSEVRLFEVGRIFQRTAAPLPDEIPMVAGVLTGRRAGWLKPGEPLDFFDAKGLVERLLERCRVREVSFRPIAAGEAPWLHPRLAAAVMERDAPIGFLGEMHPRVAEALELPARVHAFELRLEPLARSGQPAMGALPRFPGSSRDLSFFIDEKVAAATLRDIIVAVSPLLESVAVLEDYREPGRVPTGKKGMLWSLGFRANDRTLTDDEVSRELAKVVERLRTEFSIMQR